MASNWIKVEVITPDKPEIFLISEKLNIDPDMVLGKLIRLWVWADQQIAISNANSVTDSEQKERKSNASVLSKIAIDRIAFMPGFADALIYAGWLIQEGDSLFFVNFEKHNGKSSKNRALTNERVNKSRNLKRNGNDKCNAVNVTPSNQKALPEEEEEEDKELKDPPLNPPKGKSSGNKFDPLSVELPEWLSPELWAEWVAYRKQLGKPIKTQQGVSGSINKLAAYREQGHSPEYVVGLTMSNEWRGLLVPDGVASKPRRDVNVISQPDKKVPDGFRG
ncbi:hypothetical protein EcCFBP13530_04435 [Enterobacter cancerogenus]|uniref:Uncharacterized protein n=1 Tax=Enterobacter cancerogenus TaxID=69218 RepID=A0AB38P9A6_9ENTR|nr:hypothetical protein [Enterobacter cancerogenus]TKK23411.1 hypothetical protein EcCFBP13530_04435 [Enterobacter cancerogenus]